MKLLLNARRTFFPVSPIDYILKPAQHFMHIEATSGIVLIAVTLLALFLANSDFSTAYFSIWSREIGVTFGDIEFSLTLLQWINDGLMTVFFFVVGMEIKRDIVYGCLRDYRMAVMPIAAAIGGMVVPALIYLSFTHGSADATGWGVPMATDIAFVVGCLAIIGSSIPASLRALLLTLAIIDDVGAIVVIAFAYSAGIDWHALLMAGVWLALGRVLLKLEAKGVLTYLFIMSIVWFYFHESGIHPTIAGVIFGLSVPASPWLDSRRLKIALKTVTRRASKGRWQGFHDKKKRLLDTARAAKNAVSPLDRLIDDLHPWVAFLIMPLFAFANAGVVFGSGDHSYTVMTAVFAGLVLGKPLGIMLASWLTVKSGFVSLPEDLDWPTLFFGSVLAGIGFTMALFISGLGLSGVSLESAKAGVIIASALCGAIGITGLSIWLKVKNKSIQKA